MNAINMLKVFNDPELKKMKYTNGYFNDPSTLSYDGKNIVVMTDNTDDYRTLGYREQIIFNNLLVGLSQYESIEKGLDADKIRLEGIYKDGVSATYKAYAAAYGIPEEALPIKKKPFALHTESLQAMVNSVQEYQKSSLSDARLGVAMALQNQEDVIMAKIPLEVKSDPAALRSYLEEQLVTAGLWFADIPFDWLGSLLKDLWDKNLSYEQAAAQYKNLEEQPREGTYVLCKLIAQCDVWNALRSKKGSENLEFDAVWRCCIDGKSEKNGAYYFEDEPFYILAMLRGLARTLYEHALSVREESPLTRNDYENFAAKLLLDPPIHKDARAIKKQLKDLEIVKFSPKMVDRGQRFDTQPWSQDEIGIQDLVERTQIHLEAHQRIQKGEMNVRDYWLANATGFEYHSYGSLGLVCRTTPTIITNRIFYGLHQMVNQATSPGERLIAYIWAARELEVCHLFGDGNGRTAICALINWIAADDELPLYIPEDPNILDMQGPEKLIRDIHSGMVRAAELAGKQKSDIITVDELLDQAGVRGESWNVVHKRAELAEETIRDLVDKDLVDKKIRVGQGHKLRT